MSIGTIEIEHDDIDTRTITSKTTSKVYEIREQTGWFKMEGSKYPKEITFEVPRGETPYAVGFYQLTSRNITVNRFGKLEMARALRLEKVTDNPE